MNSAHTPNTNRIRHAGPPLGLVATVFVALFLGGLYSVTVFGGEPHFPWALGIAGYNPKWIVVPGIALFVCGELSWLNLITPKALFLVPLTRFPGCAWLMPPDLRYRTQSNELHKSRAKE